MTEIAGEKPFDRNLEAALPLALRVQQEVR